MAEKQSKRPALFNFFLQIHLNPFHSSKILGYIILNFCGTWRDMAGCRVALLDQQCWSVLVRLVFAMATRTPHRPGGPLDTYRPTPNTYRPTPNTYRPSTQHIQTHSIHTDSFNTDQHPTHTDAPNTYRPRAGQKKTVGGVHGVCVRCAPFPE